MNKIQREQELLDQMIRLYCRRHEGNKDLCDHCSQLRQYAFERLSRCRYGEGKPACKDCSTHCYSPERREEIRAVMRWAGPRIFWIHPLNTLRHLLFNHPSSACNLQRPQSRQSNFELLRIVAMLLVMVVHSNFIVLGVPTAQEIQCAPVSTFSSILTQSFSSVCVNVFVLISGWFGIHPTAQRFSSFVFQCLLFTFGIYAVAVLCGVSPLSSAGLKTCIPDWFVVAYIGLYILSPVLNAYIDKATPRQLGRTLLFFYLFSTLFGFTQVAHDFNRGYSLISFVGLYLLGRYVHLCPLRVFRLGKYWDLALYLGLTLCSALLAFLPAVAGLPDRWTTFILCYVFSYLSPAIILSSLFLLLFFSKMKFHSRAVNWVAASCFAVYLIHTNDNVYWPFIAPRIKYYATLGTFYHVSYNLLLIFAVYAASILLDQIRKGLWHILSGRIRWS